VEAHRSAATPASDLDTCLQAAGQPLGGRRGVRIWSRLAATGVYFYRMTEGGFEQTRKMLLLK